MNVLTRIPIPQTEFVEMEEEEMPLNDEEEKEELLSAPRRRSDSRSECSIQDAFSSGSVSSQGDDFSTDDFHSSFASICSIGTFDSIKEASFEDDSSTESEGTTQGQYDDLINEMKFEMHDDHRPTQKIQNISIVSNEESIDNEAVEDMLGQVESMLEAAVMTSIRAKLKAYRASNEKLREEQAAMTMVVTKMKSKMEQLEDDNMKLTETNRVQQTKISSLQEEVELKNSKLEMLQDMLKWRGPVEEQRSFGLSRFTSWGSNSSKTSSAPTPTTTTTPKPPASASFNTPSSRKPPKGSRSFSGAFSSLRKKSNPEDDGQACILRLETEAGMSGTKLESILKSESGRSSPNNDKENKRAPERAMSWGRKAPVAAQSWSAGQPNQINQHPSRNKTKNSHAMSVNLAACASSGDDSPERVVPQEDVLPQEDDTKCPKSQTHKFRLSV